MQKNASGRDFGNFPHPLLHDLKNVGCNFLCCFHFFSFLYKISEYIYIYIYLSMREISEVYILVSETIPFNFFQVHEKRKKKSSSTKKEIIIFRWATFTELGVNNMNWCSQTYIIQG
jgi:hypothetical protein